MQLMLSSAGLTNKNVTFSSIIGSLGVVHSEMPSDEMLAKGGRSESFQLWVNLPAKDKCVG